MNTKTTLSYYFQESNGQLPLIKTDNNKSSQLVKTELENLFGKYGQRIIRYHPPEILINKSDRTTENNISISIGGKDIVGHSLIILSQYIYYNSIWFVKNHPRHNDVMNLFKHTTNLIADFRVSNQLQKEYIYSKDPLSEFIKNSIIVYNQYLSLSRILDISQVNMIKSFPDPYISTIRYIDMNKYMFETILKQYNFIIR